MPLPPVFIPFVPLFVHVRHFSWHRFRPKISENEVIEKVLDKTNQLAVTIPLTQTCLLQYSSHSHIGPYWLIHLPWHQLLHCSVYQIFLSRQCTCHLYPTNCSVLAWTTHFRDLYTVQTIWHLASHQWHIWVEELPCQTIPPFSCPSTGTHWWCITH